LKCFTTYHLEVYLKHTSAILALLADANTVYGRIMLIMLIVCLPTNAIIWMMLVIKPLNFLTMVRILPLGLMQITGIFILHYFCATVIFKLHRPAKRFIAISIKGQQQGNLRALLKLHRYIEQFHTTNQYTVQYGRYGKITLQSFGKVRG